MVKKSTLIVWFPRYYCDYTIIKVSTSFIYHPPGLSGYEYANQNEPRGKACKGAMIGFWEELFSFLFCSLLWAKSIDFCRFVFYCIVEQSPEYLMDTSLRFGRPRGAAGNQKGFAPFVALVAQDFGQSWPMSTLYRRSFATPYGDFLCPLKMVVPTCVRIVPRYCLAVDPFVPDLS